jgi:hypothetical protein
MSNVRKEPSRALLDGDEEKAGDASVGKKISHISLP